MGEIEWALRRINANIREKDILLDLSRLNLTSANVNQLIPSIRKNKNLRTLLLNDNQIQNLPESLEALTNLTHLNLADNLLESISENILELTNLKSLNLQNNQIQTLPEDLGMMPNLEALILTNNKLQTLPESLANLTYSNCSILSLNNNPLLEETMIWVNSALPDIAIFDMAAHDEDETENYEIVLNKIFGTNIQREKSKMSALNTGSFKLGDDILGHGNLPSIPAPRATGQEVIKKFLEKIPIKNTFDLAIYIPAARNLLENVFNDDASEDSKNTTLSIMASSLGNCRTPVKSLLIQKAIGLKMEEGGVIPERYYTIAEREAFEEKIPQMLGDQLSENEKIEQVQGLLNSLFLSNSELMEENKLKISGDRKRLPSKTGYVKFAFSAIKEEALKSFAKSCCKTDSENNLLQDDSGRFILDMNKYKRITEPFLSKLGIVTKSDVDVYIQNYIDIIQNSILKSGVILLHMEKEEVKALFKINKQKDELATLLNESKKEDLQNVFDSYVAQKEEEIKEVAKICEKEQPAESEQNPGNNLSALTVAQMPIVTNKSDSDEERNSRNNVSSKKRPFEKKESFSRKKR
ncbi:leucine-rich repeat domain-containing protein [Ascidiimonas sp. W6]|uniref:leucine-rich repeat domain-containing protein n=1 Tax=Ascidiimonas meishanensis TaxID=3128903 RepID=UPI0030EC50EE